VISQGAVVLPYGERALLLQLPGDLVGTAVADSTDRADRAAEVAGWAHAIRSADLPGVLDVVPAARSVLVHLDRPGLAAEVGRLLARLAPGLGPEDAGSRSAVAIPVRYDGPDLAGVAEATGLSVGDVIRAHCGSSWRVAFAGFAPGFAYLVGGDPRLRVARRPEPRTRVPAGAVALAAGYTAVYPRTSPGGWQLIGTTEQPVWDLAQDPPALLTPGREVRFVALP
jgi:KipI family sensor histidine kinase inhibitor